MALLHAHSNTTTPHDVNDDLSGTRLVVLEDDRVRFYGLPDLGDILIGRASECDIQLDLASVSRRHARLRIGDTMTLEDLGSSNGTRVGGHILEPQRPVEVGARELIELGRVAVLVQHPATMSEPPRPQRMQRLEDVVARVAQSEISVLVLGETGVGKEVLARRIHEQSARASGPFVALNCAALSEQLLESELFGHEAGSFTGARATKPGLLETADRGTVFLDEIGELPLPAQVKLLRVLENRQVQRVGGLTPRPIDVRFVAATNRNLRAAVAAGQFRQDLLFRLNGIELVVPPLRDRTAEIPKLALGFIAAEAHKRGRPAPTLSAQAMERLLRHDWPGNVRELKNVIERAMVLSGGDAIAVEHLLFEATESFVLEEGNDDKARLLRALRECAGNQTRAAKLLGISRKTLGVRMDRYGIARPQKGQ